MIDIQVMLKVPTRSLKLSNNEPTQYLDGWPYMNRRYWSTKIITPPLTSHNYTYWIIKYELMYPSTSGKRSRLGWKFIITIVKWLLKIVEEMVFFVSVRVKFCYCWLYKVRNWVKKTISFSLVNSSFSSLKVFNKLI